MSLYSIEQGLVQAFQTQGTDESLKSQEVKKIFLKKSIFYIIYLYFMVSANLSATQSFLLGFLAPVQTGFSIFITIQYVYLALELAELFITNLAYLFIFIYLW